MKTLELTDEQYDFLAKAKDLLKTQDNRCTANPIYYFKYTDHVPTGGDWEEGFAIRNPDSTQSWDSAEDFIDYVSDYHTEFWDALEREYHRNNPNADMLSYLKGAQKTNNDWWYETIDLTEWFIEQCTEEDKHREDLLFDFKDELKGYDYIPTLKVERNYDSGCFSFFEKDLELHKEMNQHNFRKHTYSYAGSIQRAPLMLELLKLLKEIEV